MKSWQPKDKSSRRSNDDSFSSFASPPTQPKRSVGSSHMTPRKSAVSSSSNAHTHHHQSFEEVPRMQLFETKAEVQYLDDEDDLAAAVYGDARRNAKKLSKQSKKRKEGVSGYDFGALLKDHH